MSLMLFCFPMLKSQRSCSSTWERRGSGAFSLSGRERALSLLFYCNQSRSTNIIEKERGARLNSLSSVHPTLSLIGTEMTRIILIHLGLKARYSYKREEKGYSWEHFLSSQPPSPRFTSFALESPPLIGKGKKERE